MKGGLSVAIVGAGQIAGGFDRSKAPGSDGIFTHAGAYLHDGRFLLKTVCDADAARARTFAEEWGVESVAQLGEIYASHHDVVSLCTPDATHFHIICELIRHRSCKTIFAEKPLALRLDEICTVEELAAEHRVNIVVNFQRRFDAVHRKIERELAGKKILSGSALYMKGLEHNGVTLIDTVTFLCGVPRAVRALSRVYNAQVEGFSYEFVLCYDTFRLVVQTIDCEEAPYHYHIFEIDLLLADGRITINDNSRQVVWRGVADYAYSGVSALEDRAPQAAATGYSRSMVEAVSYLHDITTGKGEHQVNTPAASRRTKEIIDAVISSYQLDCTVEIGAT